DQHRGVAIEANDGAVRTLDVLGDPDHHRLHDLAFLHAPARDRFLHRNHDHVADRRIFALRAAQYLDAHDAARAGIVGHVEISLHLNHGATLVRSIHTHIALTRPSSFRLGSLPNA